MERRSWRGMLVIWDVPGDGERMGRKKIPKKTYEIFFRGHERLRRS